MSVRARMKQLLAAVGYDFGHFSLPDFATWLSQQRHRELAFVGRALPPNLYGA